MMRIVEFPLARYGCYDRAGDQEANEIANGHKHKQREWTDLDHRVSSPLARFVCLGGFDSRAHFSNAAL